MKNKYHDLKWDAPDIAAFLALPGIYKVVFNFAKPLVGKYKLEVSGFDNEGNLVRQSDLSNYNSNKPDKDLNNLYTDGLFFLSATDIKNDSANGSKSIYFVPMAYTSSNPKFQYVSYDIYDNVPFEDFAVVGNIKPSPPYS